ncbi:hypothetical protein WJX73_005278 [Symbiochloris irregularis]|uniref:SOUL heme-binding protein n=1 Tax=Symbiochloris irregularis TaxID=706552 RepID=A0AAW1PYP1_9CHLO
MKAISITVAVLLVAAAGPALAARPLDGLKDWLADHFKAAEAQLSTTAADKAPWFCHDLDCPPYKVVNKSDGYETREYKAGKWAVTQVEGLLYEPSVGVGFKRLFEFISGANEDETKIPMTAPVVTLVQPGQGPFCKSNFTVGFFMPFDFQDSPPKPKSKDVFLADSPKDTVYVTQFGGFMVDEFTLAAKVKALRQDLDDNEQSYQDDGTYITASYDPPFRLQHRHNEVHLRATSSNLVKRLVDSVKSS